MGNQRYTKSDRLRKTADYLYLSKYGDKYFSKYFIIIAKDTGRSESRLGVTVSKRIGNAGVRNKVKRIIREYFRLYIKESIKCQDINVIARKGLGGLCSRMIFENLAESFSRVVRKKGSFC